MMLYDTYNLIGMWYGMVSIISIWGYSNPWQSQGSGHEIIRVLHVTQTCKGKGQEPHCRLLSTFSTDSCHPRLTSSMPIGELKDFSEKIGETQFFFCRFWWYQWYMCVNSLGKTMPLAEPVGPAAKIGMVVHYLGPAEQIRAESSIKNIWLGNWKWVGYNYSQWNS